MEHFGRLTVIHWNFSSWFHCFSTIAGLLEEETETCQNLSLHCEPNGTSERQSRMEKIKLSVCIVQFNSAENNAVLMEEKLPQNELEVEFESMCFILVAIKK